MKRTTAVTIASSVRVGVQVWAQTPSARPRFEASLKFPGAVQVPDAGDQASWDPVRGTLTVLAGAQTAEVRVNASHGTPAMRQQHARAIARLALRR